MRIFLKIVKWTFGIILFLMVLISALLLVFKNDIKQYAIQEVNQYLNKKVHVSSAELTFWKTFPQLSLSFGDVLIYSKFDTLQTVDTAFYAQRLDLRFNPLDFYKKKYNIEEIVASDSKINLKVLTDGRVNYDFLKTSKDTVNTAFQFNLEKILLKNSAFTYTNEATQQFYAGHFKKLNFNGAFNEKVFLMKATTEFKIESVRSKSVTLVSDKKASCNITIKMDRLRHIFQIKNAALTINRLPFIVQGSVTKDSLKFYIGAKNLSLPALANNFGFKQLQTIHKIKGKGLANFNLYLSGKLGAATTPLRITADFSVKNGSLSKNGFHLSQIQLEGKYSNGINGKGEQINLAKLHFHTLNKDFDGILRISDFASPHIQGTAEGILDLGAIYQFFGPFDLQNLAGIIDMKGDFDFQMKQPEFNPKDIDIYKMKAQLALQNIQLQYQNDSRVYHFNTGEINITNQTANIHNLSVNLGKSDLLINGTLDQLSAYLGGTKKLLVNGSISGNNLTVEDLSNKLSIGSADRTWLMPDGLTGNLKISLTKVQYEGHLYQYIKSDMVFGQHQLFFSNLEGVNAGAKVKGKVQITETAPMILEINADLVSNNVLFKPLFKEWKNFQQQMITAKNIEGNAAINLQFKGPFDLFEHKILKDKFEAVAHIKISNGRLKNVDAFKAIVKNLKTSAARLLLSKRAISSFEQRLLNLQFSSFENVFTLKNGVITIPKMTIHSNAIDLNLYGMQNFDNKVDYHFDFRFRDLKGNKTSQFGDILDDNTGFHIFLHLFGTVDKPQFAWDKEASYEAKQQKKEQAAADFKSALKMGFGIGKKDSTIQNLATEKQREDKVIMSFQNNKEDSSANQPEKKKGIEKKIFQWKKQKQKEEKKKQPTVILGE